MWELDGGRLTGKKIPCDVATMQACATTIRIFDVWWSNVQGKLSGLLVVGLFYEVSLAHCFAGMALNFLWWLVVQLLAHSCGHDSRLGQPQLLLLPRTSSLGCDSSKTWAPTIYRIVWDEVLQSLSSPSHSAREAPMQGAGLGRDELFYCYRPQVLLTLKLSCKDGGQGKGKVCVSM
jgi:hypothetical protein